MEQYFEGLEKNAANFTALSPLSFLARTAKLFGTRDAVIYHDRCYNWAEVYGRCRALASGLIGLGVKRGDTVSVMAANTPELFECHYGIPMAGAVINTINIRLEVESLAYIVDHSEAKVLLVDTAFHKQIKAALAKVERKIIVIDIDDAHGPGGERQGVMDYEQLLQRGDHSYDWQLPDDEWQALALNYTSGTSGHPKGVVYHHRGSYLMSMGTIAAWQLPRHPVYLYTVPMFHCNGWGHAWTMTVQAGTIICNRVVSAKEIYRAIAKHKITHFGGAPIVLSLIANADEADRCEFDHKIEVMTAGAPPPPTVLESMRKLGFNVLQVYGLTETYGHVTHAMWREEWDDLDFSDQAERQSWQGVALPMTDDASVLDTKTLQPVKDDGQTQGEIVIRGNTVMKGYFKDDAATRASFRDGWFYTGDSAVMHANGYIQIKDRLKDVIISGGENISSIEVETVIYRHPSVSAAAVVAMPDPKWGETPCAFVELKDGESADEDQIIAFCREYLAGYKRPRKVVFQELPKTATGKIQKFQLRAIAKQLAK